MHSEDGRMTSDPGQADATTPEPVRAKLENALRLYQQGHLEPAEQVLTALVAKGVDTPDVLHLSGIVACRRGHTSRGIAYLKRAAAQAPHRADLHADLGTALLQAGRPSEAETAYRNALARAPERGDILANLAVLLRQSNRMAEAIQLLRKASTKPKTPPDVRARLAEYLAEVGSAAEALVLISPLLADHPRRADFHLIHGTVLRRLHRFDDAIAALETALSLRPSLHAAHLNLGHIHMVAGQYEAAERTYRAIPDGIAETAHARAGQGNALTVLGRFEEAHAAFDAALALAPHDAGIRHNQSLSLLSAGRYPEGWIAYDARLARVEFASDPARLRARPWQGDPLGNRSILVRCEQGLGDTVQFARFLPLLARRSGSVVFQVQPPLVRLLRCLTVAERDPVTVIGTDRPPPETDLWCPLLSLPRFLGIDLAHLPGPSPYLFPDTADVIRWRNRLADGPALKVGLIWAGNPAVWDDHLRSPGLDPLRPLFDPAIFDPTDIQFYGLQVGSRRAALQVRSLPETFQDLGGDLHDAAETAAAMTALDLIISSCTMTAHLAGALGRPLWVLLSYAADWRWLKDRRDSPWYPSARLYRQPVPRDWHSPVYQMRKDLCAVVREQRKIRETDAATDRGDVHPFNAP